MVIYRTLKFMRFPDYRVGDNGSVWSKKYGDWRRLTPQPQKSGHIHVTLRNRKGKKILLVHRLVLLAFVGEPKPGQEGCHYPDRDPANCNVKNLSWGTSKRNQRHKKKQGTYINGDKCHLSKLTWKKVRKIRRLYGTVSRKTGLVWTQVRLGERFGVDHTNIGYIVRNETWVEED